MAEGGGPVAALRELISCPVCLEIYQDPLTLDCFHSFCKECLKSYVETSRRNSGSADAATIFNCPSCRKKHAVPETGFDEMPVNFFINNIVDVHKSCTESTGVCDCCDGADDSKCGGVEWRCVDCAVSLCSDAKTWHGRMNKRLGKNHTILNIRDWMRKNTTDLIQENKEKCKTHTGKDLKFYCSVCKLSICRDCHVIEHADHKCRDLRDAAEEAQGELRDTLVHLRKSLDAVDAALLHLDRTDDALINARDDVRKKIEADKLSAISYITKYYDEITEKVDQHFIGARKNVQISIDDYKSEKICIQSACDHGDNVIKFGRSGETVDTCKRLSRLTNTQETDINQLNLKLSIKTMRFNHGDISLIKSAEILGNCEELALHPQTDAGAEEGRVDARDQTAVQTVAPPARQFVNPPQLLTSVSVDMRPWSVAVTSRGDVLVSDGNKVSVYNHNLKKRMDLDRPPSVKKWSPGYVSATADSDQLVVVNREKAADGGGLFVYDHSLQRVSRVTVDQPEAAAVTGDGDIAVLRRGDQCRGWLELYDPQTRLMTASTQAGDTVLWPHHVTSRHVTVSRATRDLIVTHHGSVTAFTRQLTPRWSYACRGQGEHGELVWPRGVCVDADGRVLVSDYSTRRVIVLSGEGEYVTHLHTDQLIQGEPLGLTLTASGQLVVGAHDRKVYFMKYN